METKQTIEIFLFMFSVNWGYREDWDLSLALSGLILSQKLTDKK